MGRFKKKTEQLKTKEETLKIQKNTKKSLKTPIMKNKFIEQQKNIKNVKKIQKNPKNLIEKHNTPLLDKK